MVVLWATVLTHALSLSVEADRLANWIKRGVLVVCVGLACFLINESFFGLTPEDLLNNRVLYPVCEWYRVDAA